MPFGYCCQLLPLHSDFSDSRQNALFWHTCTAPAARQGRFTGLFPNIGLPLSGRLLLRPEGLHLLIRASLRHGFAVDGSVFSPCITVGGQSSRAGIPAPSVCAFPHASKHWLALFIELVIGMVELWSCQGSVLYGLIITCRGPLLVNRQVTFYKFSLRQLSLKRRLFSTSSSKVTG